MVRKSEQKKRKSGALRNLGKPIYVFLFPLLFAGGYLAFRNYCENYYHTEWPVWTLLLVFPLLLLGIAVGYQVQFYLRKAFGETAETVIDVVLSLIFVIALFAEYQYVIAPQTGLPPLSWEMLWDGLKKHFQFRKK